MNRYAQWISGKKGRWIVLIAWIVLAALLNMVFPQASSQKNELAAKFEQTVPSEEAEKLMEKEFASGAGTPALLTWYRETGLSSEDLTQIQQLTKDLTDQPVAHQESVAPFHQLPPQALPSIISEDGTTLIMPLSFKKNTETEDMEKSLEEVESRISQIFTTDPFQASLNSDELLVRTTGPAGISVDATKLFSGQFVFLRAGLRKHHI